MDVRGEGSNLQGALGENWVDGRRLMIMRAGSEGGMVGRDIKTGRDVSNKRK